ncbi:hypothetical protein Smp_193320, partial [Schistosoma mansoni]|uniref:hypothetical protein n=1 Tax=Schistosoma mansoni TaxID=6183 RepID=UPI00022C842D
ASSNIVTLKDTSIVNEVEKLQFFNFQLSIIPYARVAYGIAISNSGKLQVELCSVDYLLTENNSIKKVSSKYHTACFHFLWFLKDSHKEGQTLPQ